jgi:hypothetical protein
MPAAHHHPGHHLRKPMRDDREDDAGNHNNRQGARVELLSGCCDQVLQKFDTNPDDG